MSAKPLSSPKTLRYVDPDSFKGICWYLSTSELLALWSSNDLAIQALLRASNALQWLSLAYNDVEGLITARAWAKTVQKPRIGTFVLPNELAKPYEDLYWLIFRHFGFQRVKIENIGLTYGVDLLDLLPLDPRWFLGVSEVIISSQTGAIDVTRVIKVLPETMTGLIMSGVSFALDMEHALQLQNLVSLSLSNVRSLLIDQPRNTSAPILLPDLARLTPQAPHASHRFPAWINSLLRGS